jgi:hypothetical protein
MYTPGTGALRRFGWILLWGVLSIVGTYGLSLAGLLPDAWRAPVIVVATPLLAGLSKYATERQRQAIDTPTR